jgi:SAM-dependent methyltransferase
MTDSLITKSLTINRVINLIRLMKTNSIFRSLQYEMLDETIFYGEILDFGGGELAHYRSRIDQNTIYSINIDPTMKPTWLIEASDIYPIIENKFDVIISLNTLEHVFDAECVINKMAYNLRDGGSLHITTPFIFQIHGHPMDYLRLTPQWYEEVAKRNGFSRCEITMLSLGNFSLRNSLGLSLIRGYFGKIFALFMDYLMYKIKSFIKSILNKKIYQSSCPIGLWVVMYR